MMLDQSGNTFFRRTARVPPRRHRVVVPDLPDEFTYGTA